MSKQNRSADYGLKELILLLVTGSILIFLCALLWIISVLITYWYISLIVAIAGICLLVSRPVPDNSGPSSRTITTRDEIKIPGGIRKIKSIQTFDRKPSGISTAIHILVSNLK